MKKLVIHMLKFRGIAGFFILTAILLFSSIISFAQDGVSTTTIDVNLNESIDEMYPLWAFWGYDEPNYTYMADAKKLLTEISDLSPVPDYISAHSMLNKDEGPGALLKWGSGNAYMEDKITIPGEE